MAELRAYSALVSGVRHFCCPNTCCVNETMYYWGKNTILNLNFGRILQMYLCRLSLRCCLSVLPCQVIARLLHVHYCTTEHYRFPTSVIGNSLKSCLSDCYSFAQRKHLCLICYIQEEAFANPSGSVSSKTVKGLEKWA